MLTIFKLQGLEWKQHAYIIHFLNNVCLDKVKKQYLGTEIDVNHFTEILTSNDP